MSATNLGIATDLQNANFSGAVANPDDLLSVEFYYHEPVDAWASQEKGVEVRLPKVPFVRIAVPGNKDQIIEKAASPRDATRFAVQWMRFQMQNGLVENDRNMPGWHIEDWAELSDDQKKFLNYARFQTVEQIAGASDAQIQTIGMGGAGLRERARIALRLRMDEGVKAEIAKRDGELQAVKDQLAKLMERLGEAAPNKADAAPAREILTAKK